MDEYLERYLAGEMRMVWDAIGQLIYAEMPPKIQDDIRAVCAETMRRVRHNADRLIAALASIGFQFGVYPDGQDIPILRGPLVGPDPSIESKIHELVSQVGPVPPSLSSFWRIVGTICLIGKHPDLPLYSAPLMVDPIDATLEELETWRELVEEHGATEIGSFRAPIAPDMYHKDNVSGGDWYGIWLPCLTVDAALSGEPHNTTFIEYLRIAFRAKGFPGASEIPTSFEELNVEFVEF